MTVLAADAKIRTTFLTAPLIGAALRDALAVAAATLGPRWLGSAAATTARS